MALAFGCGDITSNPTEKTLASLSIAPATASLKVGGSTSFQVLANYSDASSASIIPSWSVSGGIGSVTAAGYTGLFTATGEGTGSVNASYQTKSVSAAITVTASQAANGLVTLEVSPASLQARVGTTQIFTANGVNSSGESVAVSPVWTMIGDPVGTFSFSGTVATLETTSQGSAEISCVSGEVSGYSYVTIEGYSVDITVETDTYVDESNPTTTEEGQTVIKAGYLTGPPGEHYELYLIFSLAALPSSASIESATLHLYPTAADTPAFQLYNLTSAFSGTTTWSDKPSVGSYLLAKTFTADQYNDLSGDGLLSSVRAWYTTPAANYGLALKQDAATNGIVSLTSKENGATPPYLTIEYH